MVVSFIIFFIKITVQYLPGAPMSMNFMSLC